MTPCGDVGHDLLEFLLPIIFLFKIRYDGSDGHVGVQEFRGLAALEELGGFLAAVAAAAGSTADAETGEE